MIRQSYRPHIFVLPHLLSVLSAIRHLAKLNSRELLYLWAIPRSQEELHAPSIVFHSSSLYDTAVNMSATPQDSSNGQNPGVDLTLTGTFTHSSTGQESSHAEISSLLPTRGSVDASDPAISQAEHGAVPTSIDTGGGAGLPSQAPLTPLSQLLPLQATLATMNSATSLLSRPQSIVGNSSSKDDLVSRSLDFEILRRRTLAQQPYRGMVRTNGCEYYQMSNYAQSPHVKARWRKFISIIQTQNMVCSSSPPAFLVTMMTNIMNHFLLRRNLEEAHDFVLGPRCWTSLHSLRVDEVDKG
jgi:hypothetical protein